METAACLAGSPDPPYLDDNAEGAWVRQLHLLRDEGGARVGVVPRQRLKQVAVERRGAHGLQGRDHGGGHRGCRRSHQQGRTRGRRAGCCCRWDGSEGQPGVFESLLGHEEGRQELRAAPRALRSSQGKIYRYIYTGSIQYCKLYIG